MNEDALILHRLQFAFTLVFHYLFPQLTMGIAWFLVAWKWLHLRTGDPRYGNAARLWARIFGINFAVGVVTGIPMEFQFGTNWSGFSKFAGGVIGQTLAMEGMFAFFLESALVGALVWGEKRLGPRSHFFAAVAVALGSWTSGYFILVTNAFMQHPAGYSVAADHSLRIESMRDFLLNPWAIIQFCHNQAAALVTGSFVIAAVGAFYILRNAKSAQGELFLNWGIRAGLVASLLVAFPTGDQQAKIVARYQGPALAAMEGRFESGPMADITLIGQPNIDTREIANPIRVPGLLSFLAFWLISARCSRVDRVPPGHLADQYRAPLLFVPRDGRVGHVVHRPDGPCQSAKVPWAAEIQRITVVVHHAGVSIPFHSQHGRMDDCGTGDANRGLSTDCFVQARGTASQ